MIAAYLRVSSEQQDVATQRHAVERAAAARGDTLTAIYSEKVSGGTMARPELRRLRADAKAGKVRRIYVYALDRLTRTGVLDTFSLVAEFRDAGAELVTVADPFPLDGVFAEPMIALMAWASKQERTRLLERLAAARRRIEAAGGRWGRPSRITIIERRAIEGRRAAGQTIRAIAVALKIPKATVGRVCASRKGGGALGAETASPDHTEAPPDSE